MRKRDRIFRGMNGGEMRGRRGMGGDEELGEGKRWEWGGNGLMREVCKRF